MNSGGPESGVAAGVEARWEAAFRLITLLARTEKNSRQH
jgi:hypothetical protein